MRTILLGAALFAAPAMAADLCKPTAIMRMGLLPFAETEEKPPKLAYINGVFVGILEFTENKTTKTWTLLLTTGGQTCILFSNGQERPEPPS